MPRKLARSLGPRQLVQALEQRDTLQARDQEVTFLAEIDASQPEASDVWRYGNGAELGVFVFVESDGIAVQREVRPDDGHDPARHTDHVWVRNDEVALPFDSAVLVKDVDELRLTLDKPHNAAAIAALDAHRGRTVAAVEESTLTDARALITELDAYRGRVAAMCALPEATVTAALAQEGMQGFVLEIDPEHLQPIVRQAVMRVADRLGC